MLCIFYYNFFKKRPCPCPWDPWWPHEGMLSSLLPRDARVPIFSRTAPPPGLPAGHSVGTQQISREGTTPLFARRSKGRMGRWDQEGGKKTSTPNRKKNNPRLGIKELSSDTMKGTVGVSSSMHLLMALHGHTIILVSASTPIM